jgi:YggT family protein
MNAFGDIFGFVVQIFSFLLLIRLLLQLVQADFYNPISQTIFKICAPVVNPLSKLFPTIGTLNTAALMAAIAVQWSFYLIFGLIKGMPLISILVYVPMAAYNLLFTLIEIYFWGIFILAISSWIGTTGHPTVRLVAQIVEPYLRPFRKFVPPMGMMDFSPMVAIISLIIIRNSVLPVIGGFINSLLV